MTKLSLLSAFAVTLGRLEVHSSVVDSICPTSAQAIMSDKPIPRDTATKLTAISIVAVFACLYAYLSAIIGRALSAQLALLAGFLLAGYGWLRLFKFQKQLTVLQSRAKGQLSAADSMGSSGDALKQVELLVDDLDKSVADLRLDRLLLEKTSEVICLLDETATFVRLNSASTHCWGYSPSELVGKSIGTILPECGKSADTIDRASQAFSNLLSLYSSSGSFEGAIQKKDGTLAIVLWSIHWSQSEKYFSCVAHDITFRKQLESEREKLEQMKQQFLASITHDLLTPLAATKAFLGCLTDGVYGDISENALKRAKLASQNINLLISLTNNMLDMEKAESGTLTLNLSPVKVSTLIDEAVEGIRPLIELNKLSVVKDCPPEIFAELDADRMIQVLNNLLANAIKFSPAGAKIQVGCRQDDNMVQIFVEDEGKGIPESQVAKIFDRFYQIANADPPKQGYGLGLAICKSLVEQHGGKITAINLPKGCRFELNVPGHSKATTCAIT
jgi:PAS domain S-box-containing protein